MALFSLTRVCHVKTIGINSVIVLYVISLRWRGMIPISQKEQMASTNNLPFKQILSSRKRLLGGGVAHQKQDVRVFISWFNMSLSLFLMVAEEPTLFSKEAPVTALVCWSPVFHYTPCINISICCSLVLESIFMYMFSDSENHSSEIGRTL